MKLWVNYALKGCELRDEKSCYIISHYYNKIGGHPCLFDEDAIKQE